MMRLMDETAATVDALAGELREQKIALHLCDVMMRLMDETAATVDALAGELREQKIALHLCGGPHGSLPWLAEDDATTDPITMLVPAYRMIEQTARACGLDPDRPPRLSKITETF
jgi:glutamine---fructose-6-phosphate transaminase (isomerizing)